jgi:RsiW-degrading membrane proteinase PrsW (M82 family)
MAGTAGRRLGFIRAAHQALFSRARAATLSPEALLKALIALTPVIVFLLVLVRLDTHRLIGHQLLARVFVSGTALAVLAYFVNGLLLDLLQLSFTQYSRLVAPLVEETMKALVLVWLFRRERIGFQIDAAIFGFTVGAGFSFAENLFYLYHAGEAHHVIWMVRGFGTAIMHGGCTALFGVLAQMLIERRANMPAWWYLPPLLAATLFHALFNHFPVSPVLASVATLLLIPTLLFLLFEKNEVTIHNFLEQDFDRHQNLLLQLRGGPASGCSTGRFLRDLERYFKAPVRDHMRAYIHLHTELILSAEGILLAREHGLDIVVEDATHKKIEELHSLERTIGKAGMHALSPHLQLSRHEFWVIHMFEDEVKEMPAAP